MDPYRIVGAHPVRRRLVGLLVCRRRRWTPLDRARFGFGARHYLSAPRRVRSEDAVVQEQVYPRAWYERDEALKQFHRCEDEMRRPIRPRPLQADRDSPVAEPVEAALADRRAAEVLAETLEPLAIARLDVDGGMEVEAAVVGVERDVAIDPRRIQIGADPDRTLAGTRAEGGAAEDRRPGKARQRRGLVRERIGVLVADRRARESQALEPPAHARDDAADVLVRRWRGRMEAERPLRLADEHAVEDERVEMEVRVQGAAKALHARHHAGLSTDETLAARGAPVRAAERSHEHVQHRATEPVVVREPVAEAVRDGQYPLANGDIGGEHVIDEMRGALGHAPPAAARTDRAPLTGKGGPAARTCSPRIVRGRSRERARRSGGTSGTR